MKLPEPCQEALLHSHQLRTHLNQKMQALGGSITFDQYMQTVLYEPGLGYYSAGSHKIGAAGDFTTAPEISPLYGQSLARAISPYFDTHVADSLLELGPGSGRLARDVLLALADLDALPTHYYLLEVSADLKQRQQDYLREQLPAELLARCCWLEHLPPSFAGVVVANEVLDALAVHVFQCENDRVLEASIKLQPDGTWQPFFAPPTQIEVSQRLERLRQQYALSEGYQSELNLWQEALLNSLANLLQQGLLIFVDYGFPAREYYHPDRSQGTLCCHYRHHVHHDPYWWPGLQDITAHVDFTALATCGLKAGLSLALYTNQAEFLLHHGILDRAQTQASDALLFKQSQALQTLMAPHEMGELFKVMAFYKNTFNPFAALAEQDKRHTL